MATILTQPILRAPDPFLLPRPGRPVPNSWFALVPVGPPPPSLGRIVTLAATPFGSVTSLSLALLTNQGRLNLSRQATEGLVFQPTHFQVGQYGYNPTDPTQALAVNPADTTLTDPIWPAPIYNPGPPPVGILEPVDDVVYPNSYSVTVLCRLESGEAWYGLGELGIWATILYSPNAPEIGTQFLFAIAHFPFNGKSMSHTSGMLITVAP